MSRHRAWSNSGRYPAYLELKLDLTRDTGPFSLSDRPSAWFIIASAQMERQIARLCKRC